MKNLVTLLTAQTLLAAALAAPPAAHGRPSRRAAGAPHQQQAPAAPQQTQPAARPRETPAPSPSPAELGDDEVVRITTNLVQLDAVVTDKKGRPVTDLTAADFEVFEDGRPQKITNLSYVSSAPEAAPAPARPDASQPGAPAPPRRLRSSEVRRTIALVVDDLGLSFETTHYTRQALRKFVDEQVQPGDLVAIIRTSAGVGALQQFTSDRRQLHAAIKRVRWYASGRGGIGVFAPIVGDPTSGAADAAVSRAGTGSDGADSAADSEDELNDFREEYFAVGTLGALNFVVRGMRELPGRKSVVLFSEGFALYSPDRGGGRGRSDRVLESLRRLTDLANRASVVVYAMDVRGVVYTGLTAADSGTGLTPKQIEERLADRGRRLFDTQSGLSYLAQQTGGLFIRNTNDLAGGVRRVLEDQRGYYLIGYRPERETFDRRFHRLSAKVITRPGLTVRTRTGFYGVAEEDLRPATVTGEQRLRAALMSPFSSSEIDVRLSALFTTGPRSEPFVHSQMHFDTRDLKFERAADGWHEAQIEVVAVAFTDGGRVVDQHYLGQTLRLRPDTYEQSLRSGLIYTFNVPVKKAGAYQLRTAVRDTATGRVGSSSQFIEVPDLKKNRLTLSGLVVGASLASTAAPGAAGAPLPASAAGGQGQRQQQGAAGPEEDPEATHVVRRFRQRTYFDYAYLVYNARADRATGLPRLTMQARLFRDGRQVFVGSERPIGAAGQPDPKRIIAGGRLLLGMELGPGEYVLQVVVTDSLRRDKGRITAQWIDFEVVK